MNKNLYRIVFNKARGMLMVVADIAASGRAAASPASGVGHTLHRRVAALSRLPFALLLALGCISLPLQAAIVADGRAPGNQRPTVGSSANGTPQVNIQTPSRGGVSRNVYSQFDVDKKGVILNNAAKNVQTQLGGMIAANPLLVKGSASVILNEVNARDPSKLNGFIEVAGKKAQVVIANPAGITCDGCGFINANRATLTTGQAQLNNGLITGYDVSRGEIVVQGNGLDSSRQDYTDIIARSVKVNAGIWANDLSVTLGANRVSADNKSVQPREAAEAAQPKFALDVSSIGGMYAGKIRLTGTEKGLGVHNAGTLGATAGNVVINADGIISNAGVVNASGNLQLTTKAQVSNRGTLYAKADTRVNAVGSLTNEGILGAGKNTAVTASAITSLAGSAITAGMNEAGKPENNGSLTLSANNAIRAHGQLLAGDNIRLTGSSLDLSGAQNFARGEINLLAKQGGVSLAQGKNQASGRFTINAQGDVNNSGGVLLAKTLTVKSASVDNRKGILQAENATLVTHSLNNQRGMLFAAGDLHIDTQGGALNNRDTREENTGIRAQGTLTLHAGGLDNHAGFIAAQQATLDLSTMHNGGGVISGNGSLGIDASALDNADGRLQSAGDITLTSAQGLNNARGDVLADGALTVTGGAINNQQGLLQGGEKLTLERLSQLDNRGGNLLSGGELALTAQALDNRKGKLFAFGNAAVTVQETVDNRRGFIKANDSLRLTSNLLQNSDTRDGACGIEAGDIYLNAQEVDNHSGRIQSANALHAVITALLNNDNGRAVSGSMLDIQGAALRIDNQQGALYADDTLRLTALLLSGGGTVQAGEDLALTLQQALHNKGTLSAGGNLNLHSDAQIINEGTLGAGQELTLRAQSLDNRENGEISATRTLLSIVTTLQNVGLIDGSLTHIIADTLKNIGTGRLYGDHIALEVNHLINDKREASDNAAVIAARERLDIGAGDILNRNHALIYSGGDMSIGRRLDSSLNAADQGGSLKNHSAQIEAAGNLSLSINDIDNRDINLELSNELFEVSREKIEEWQYCEGDRESTACNDGDGIRYVLTPENGRLTRYGLNSDGSINYNVQLLMHEGGKNRMRFRVPGYGFSKHFIQYLYEKIISETKIVRKDAASITSGGNMTVAGGTLTNQDSRIVAGGDFINRGATLKNLETKGTQTIVDVGTRISYYKKGDWHTARDEKDYDGDDISRDLSLGLLRFDSNTGTGGDGYAVNDRGDVTVSDNGGGVNTGSAPDKEGSLTWTGVDVPAPSTQLPDSSLYHINPGPSADYLVETDPRFTNQKPWLGSDYMQKRLANDPDNLLKRLGDGYYEQALIRDQIIRATGQRYLEGQQNDEAQYRMLMDNGIAFAQAFDLRPGVALTAEQMAQLTTSIVWLVKQTVKLPDGSTEEVLVPQVYLKVNQNSVNGNGTLLAGNRVISQGAGDVTNSGTIAGREVTRIDANSMLNSGFIQGGAVDISAKLDIRNQGGTLLGDNSVSLTAGRDLISESLTRGTDTERWISSPATIWVQNEGGSLTLAGMRDVTLTAGLAGTHGEGSSTAIVAGNNLTLNTVTTAHEENYYRNDKQYDLKRQTQEEGTQLNSGGSLTLSAGNNLTARAADVMAGGMLTASAGNNLTLESGESTFDHVTNDKWTTKGFLSKTKHETHDETHERRAQGSSFSGESIILQAGKDLTVRGSSVAGTQDVALSAGENLVISTSDEAQHETHMHQKKKSGVMGTGGIGFTVGSASQKVTTSDESNLKKGSVVGSSQGSLLLSAGRELVVHGSELIAGKNMALSGSDVSITAAENSHTSQTVTEQKSSGFTLAISGTAGNALNKAVTTAKEAKKEGNGRVAALQGTKAVLSGYETVQATSLDEAKGSSDGANNNTIGVSLSYGSQKSRAETKTEERYHQGSGLTAGDNISVTATGAKGNGDITIQGSELQAGRDVLLSASRDLNLVSSADTSKTEGSNTSSGGSVGVSVGVGSGGASVNVNASMNKGKGHEKGNGVSHNETQINAGREVTMVSGRDTLLQGAQVSGETIKADVGRNLTLKSEQDSDRYDMEQKNVSAGVSIPVYGAGSASASVSMSKDKMHSNYDAVQEQTGLFAGKGGFDVTVGEHTQLDGAVIASTADASLNKLDTGTLGFSDIENRADYKVEHQSVGFGTGGGGGPGDVTGQIAGSMANSLLTGVNKEGHESSVTRAAVSEGSIIIRDKDKQQQDTAELSRDVENANPGLAQIFDKEREQQRIKEAQLIGEIGNQVSVIARTEGEISALKKAREANPGIPSDKLSGTPEYMAEMAKWGTGSTIQRAIQSATAAVQGLAGGDLAKAIAGGSAPYIATVIKQTVGEENKAANLMAHAAVNAALALASGNNALAAATGAAVGEAMGMIAISYYGKDVSQLTESERQTVSALATLAAGLAGGLVGDSTASAVTAAQAGKTTVENNSLSGDKARETVKQAAESLKNQVRDKLGEGTTSSIANGIINALADTGDAALGGVDYAADAAMALASCATGDSYCSRAMSDLSGKNQTVADSVKTLMQSETWSAVADTIKQASEGNQAALEATGGMLAGIILPGKKIPNVVKAVDPNIKIATGATVGDFEASLFKLPSGERVAIVKQTAAKVVVEHGMIKDNKLTKMNNRDVYRGTDGNLYALDTQHGRFEVVTPHGKHVMEVNFAMKEIPDSKDKSGGHNLRVK